MIFKWVCAAIMLCPWLCQAQVFKSFRQKKVQLQSAIAVPAGEELLLLVDQECLDQQLAASKKMEDPLLAMGFIVQHKSSGGLRHRAVSAKLRAGSSADQLETVLRGQPCIHGVAENPVVQVSAVNDPLYGSQAALPAISQLEGEKFFFHPLFGIRREVTLAVIDSGAQLDHPDLQSRLWRGPNGEYGYDFANGDADPSDDFGHGTHVAGIALAQKDNGTGIRGVMGEWSRLMPVKSQGDAGQGTMADVINAFRWAVDQGADVVNLSLASRQQNQALVDALEYALSKEVTVVVAAGNDGEQITASNFISPAGYASSYNGVIGVGSIDANTKARSNFSNFSPQYIELSAPGSPGSLSGILSTYVSGRYFGINGTSMSAPHVSGAAALVAGFYKTHALSFSPASVEEALMVSADRHLPNQTFFAEGRGLNLENLGRFIFNSTVVDSTGGFDDP